MGPLWLTTGNLQSPPRLICPFSLVLEAVHYQGVKNLAWQMFVHLLTHYPAFCHHGKWVSRRPVGRFERAVGGGAGSLLAGRAAGTRVREHVC